MCSFYNQLKIAKKGIKITMYDSAKFKANQIEKQRFSGVMRYLLNAQIAQQFFHVLCLLFVTAVKRFVFLLNFRHGFD